MSITAAKTPARYERNVHAALAKLEDKLSISTGRTWPALSVFQADSMRCTRARSAISRSTNATNERQQGQR